MADKFGPIRLACLAVFATGLIVYFMHIGPDDPLFAAVPALTTLLWETSVHVGGEINRAERDESGLM